MAKLATLTNPFLNLRYPWAVGFANGGTWSVSGGQLSLSVPANTVSAYARVVTYTASPGYIYWDLTGSSVVVQVNAGAQNANLEVWAPQLLDSLGNWFGWHIVNGVITVSYGGTVINSQTYSTTTHAWLRIRETGGTTYYDFSSDGMNWTQFTFVPDTNYNYALTEVYPNLYIGSSTPGVNPTATAVFDNFNLPPTAPLIPTYAVPDNLLAPTALSALQTFTDVNGEVYVAKSTVNGGRWTRARDALHGVIYRTTAGYTMPTSTTGGGGIIAFDAVSADVYGMNTGTPNFGFKAPVAGWYRVYTYIQCVASVVNTFTQGSITQLTSPAYTVATLWTSDNYFTSRGSGGLCWRSLALVYSPINDIWQIRAYNTNGYAVSQGLVTCRMEFDFLGSG